jgi:hypothetical protein
MVMEAVMLKRVARLGAIAALTIGIPSNAVAQSWGGVTVTVSGFPGPAPYPYYRRPVPCCYRPYRPHYSRPWCCYRPYYGYYRPPYFYGDYFAPHHYNWYRDAGYGYDDDR